MRNNRVRYGAIPLHDDGREMMGTHGSVTVDGRYVLTHIVGGGEYVSRETFIRYAVSKYGTPGVTYAIYRGGFGSSARKDGPPYTVPHATSGKV